MDTSGVGQRLRVGDCRRGSLEETGIQEPPADPRVLADGIPAGCATSAPVVSHTSAVPLMNEILVGRNEFAATLTMARARRLELGVASQQGERCSTWP